MPSPSRRFALLLLLAVGLVTSTALAQPHVGQVIEDPDRPGVLMRHEGGHVYVCAPGDPEDFLYRGTQNPDRTRNGDQVDIINRMIEHGGNGMYLQAVRSHGGDGDNTHQPFLGGDSDDGLEPAVVDQWEEWFDLMDDNEIVMYLIFYDDGSTPHGTGNAVTPSQELFVQQLVDRFEHHRNLIWATAEEYNERYSVARMENLAARIAFHDDHDHVIAVHHWDRPWAHNAPFNQFDFASSPVIKHWMVEMIDLSRTLGPDWIHQEMVAIKQVSQTFGYSANFAEWFDGFPLQSEMGQEMRFTNWATGMAGLHMMVFHMFNDPTPDEDLQALRTQQEFFETTNWYDLDPRDDLAFSGTKWVMALPPDSYIAYAPDLTGNMGISGMAAGRYDFHWVDCASGERVQQIGMAVGDGDQAWPKPGGFSEEVAVWVVNSTLFDLDGDGIADPDDNCPDVVNGGQADDDGDGNGNACDACPLDPDDDEDADGLCGDVDNCPAVDNVDQADDDGDLLGNACDACPLDADNDVDGDLVCGEIDNCPDVANAAQADGDGDRVGDACDPCLTDSRNDPDRDGLCDDVDNCPDDSNASQGDFDRDSLGDACDPCRADADNDIDADGFCGNIDNCPDVSNAFQVDLDGDRVGDACDPCPLDALDDGDGDGTCANVDNCPTLSNPGQEDLDGDGEGDDCDLDIDGDGSPNDLDCDPLNADVLGRPEESRDLRAQIDASDGRVRLAWLGGAGIESHAIVSGRLGELRSDASLASACRIVADATLSWADGRDGSDSWYYLVAAENTCGSGSLGSSSLGTTDVRSVVDVASLPVCP
ncbi:MAG: thrombospondin type 3 repeat-containing protein [Acidobacteriota bacterium]